MANTRPLFGLYVHWPYCLSKCPYCDFNSHVSDAVDHDLFLAAYKKELNFIAAQIPKRPLTSIFFGGGTPSLMKPFVVEAIINEAEKIFGLSADCEITLEANPTSVEADKFADFSAANINRVSLGLQSLDDKALIFLGRTHSAAEGIAALQTAQKQFDRVSFDLMYTRPGQTLTAWKDELEQALTLGTDHLSLYQLTIEQGTPFYTQHQRGEFEMPDGDTGGGFYEETNAHLNAAGLPAYEISNHARAGQESRHNLCYWQADDYIGIGPGAHGRVMIKGQRTATRTHRAPDIWLKHCAEKGHGFHPFEAVADDDIFIEKMMMGLRLTEGVPLKDIPQNFIMSGSVQTMISQNFLEKTATHLRATMAGRQRLNAVLSYIL